MLKLGPLEVVGIILVVLLLFGPKRLPEIGKAFGRTIQEFRHATKEHKDPDGEGKADEPKS